MANKLTILSIDFDFFQKVDAETLKTCYPDGIDTTTELSEVVWSSHYADPRQTDKLLQVEADLDKINEMLILLNKCNRNIPVLVANSHVEIYNFIMEKAKKRNTSKVDIINVDMHHDMFNDNYEMDCGNWIKFIMQDLDASVKWIANPVSKEVYGLKEKIFDQIREDFSGIIPEKIDALFVCRSDIWFPPHLDDAFDAFLRKLCRHFSNVYGESSIKSPRNIIDLTSQIERLYKNKK